MTEQQQQKQQAIDLLESRYTSSLDVYAERSQARRESVKDEDHGFHGFNGLRATIQATLF